MRPPVEWPAALAPNPVCLTVDVEWAHPDVLADLVGLIDAAGIRATFFVTHAGVGLPHHERGLHPNFRRDGDSHRAWIAAHPAAAADALDRDLHQFVLDRTLAFAPEARGVRTHSLYADSTLLPRYRERGIEYDCTARLPLVAGLRPVWQQHDVLAIPTFYADHFDLHTQATGFRLDGLRLDQAGVKVLDFHPNMVFINAVSDEHYQSTRQFYHDPEQLLRLRHGGRGVRTLLVELLEHLEATSVQTLTTGELNRRWRAMPQVWG